MNAMQKKVYDLCCARPPQQRGNGIGQAYFRGLEFPDDPPGVRAGEKSSMAYAAWRAGRDAAKKKSP